MQPRTARIARPEGVRNTHSREVSRDQLVPLRRWYDVETDRDHLVGTVSS
jgi:hypothetical protein